MSFDAPLLVTFLAYLLLILYLGVKAYRRTHDLGDYILGGRKLGSLVTALSVGASDMSGWLLLGLPGAIYLANDDILRHGKTLQTLHADDSGATDRLIRGFFPVRHQHAESVPGQFFRHAAADRPAADYHCVIQS